LRQPIIKLELIVATPKTFLTAAARERQFHNGSGRLTNANALFTLYARADLVVLRSRASWTFALGAYIALRAAGANVNANLHDVWCIQSHSCFLLCHNIQLGRTDENHGVSRNREFR
jgi:hypothetical protein